MNPNVEMDDSSGTLNRRRRTNAEGKGNDAV